MIEFLKVQPVLLTAAEAARYLRLDEGDRDIADAIQSLDHLIRTGRVRPCRVGKCNRFSLKELDRFIDEQTVRYGKKNELQSD